MVDLKIAIVDDEPRARATLRSLLLEYCPTSIVVAEASGVEDAYHMLATQPFDLVLLDVEMSDGTGFDLLDQISTLKSNVIFTTAHDEFAIRAFRYNAIDYLLKPINPDELIIAIQKAKEKDAYKGLEQKISNLKDTNSGKDFSRITLITNEGPVFAKTNDITHLESYGNYTYAHLSNRERHLVSRNLKEFEEMLPFPNFFRCHQSHLINTAYVKMYLKEEGGSALLRDGDKIPVARRRKDALLEILHRKYNES